MTEGDNGQKPEQGHLGEPEHPPQHNPDLSAVNPDFGDPPVKPPRSHAGQVWKGIGLLTLLHLLLFVFPFAFFAIGVVQLIYLIPALIICRKNTGMVQGMWIAAGITFLLNAACFGFVSFSFS